MTSTGETVVRYSTGGGVSEMPMVAVTACCASDFTVGK